MKNVFEYCECPNLKHCEEDSNCMNVVKAMIYILHQHCNKTKDKTLSTLYKSLDHYTCHVFLLNKVVFHELLKMCKAYD